MNLENRNVKTEIIGHRMTGNIGIASDEGWNCLAL
jgi:hypothetical protein